MSENTDEASTTGAVELREDIPLKPSGSRTGAGKYFSGIRFVVGCFSVLTAAITVALATQIYYEDYELVPHGSVASDAAACSRAGTDALKAGGGAADAAIAAALCLAVLNPHTTGLDAGGSVMIYDYRRGRSQGPSTVDFSSTAQNSSSPQTPRLVTGLSWLYVRYGKLPWRQLVEPAAVFASRFSASSSLAAATQYPARISPFGVLSPGQEVHMPRLAEYLRVLANKTNEELEHLASGGAEVREATATRTRLEGFVLFTAPAQPTGVVLAAALRNLLAYDSDEDRLKQDRLVFRYPS